MGLMIATDRKTHWETVYSTKAETGVSWYQDEPRLSLELIGAVAPAEGGRIIDVGGGASVLVDRLLDLPFGEIAVLDISETALGKARARLGERAERVRWVVADVTEAPELGTFDVWHDRAVFHFLTDAADRRSYVELARQTVPEGGHLIIATFADDGPEAVQRPRRLPLQRSLPRRPSPSRRAARRIDPGVSDLDSVGEQLHPVGGGPGGAVNLNRHPDLLAELRGQVAHAETIVDAHPGQQPQADQRPAGLQGPARRVDVEPRRVVVAAERCRYGPGRRCSGRRRGCRSHRRPSSARRDSSRPSSRAPAASDRTASPRS